MKDKITFDEHVDILNEIINASDAELEKYNI